MIRKTTLAVSSAAILFAAPAFAQNSAATTVTVNGNVISPLTVSSTTALTMPTVVKPIGSGSSSVQLECSAASGIATGVATWSPNANPFVGGSPNLVTIGSSRNGTTPAPGARYGSCGSVIVNGESGYYFLTTTGYRALCWKAHLPWPESLIKGSLAFGSAIRIRLPSHTPSRER